MMTCTKKEIEKYVFQYTTLINTFTEERVNSAYDDLLKGINIEKVE